MVSGLVFEIFCDWANHKAGLTTWVSNGKCMKEQRKQTHWWFAQQIPRSRHRD